jgi:hypothetical protein
MTPSRGPRESTLCPHRASCDAVSPGALPNVQKVIKGSLGGALDITQRAPTKLGELLTAVAHARQTFISGGHGTYDRRRRGRRSCHRRAGAASQQGRGLTNLGWTGTFAGSDESGQLDTWPAGVGSDRTRLRKAQGSRLPRDRRTPWEGWWGPLALLKGDLGRQT